MSSVCSPGVSPPNGPALPALRNTDQNEPAFVKIYDMRAPAPREVMISNIGESQMIGKPRRRNFAIFLISGTKILMSSARERNMPRKKRR